MVRSACSPKNSISDVQRVVRGMQRVQREKCWEGVDTKPKSPAADKGPSTQLNVRAAVRKIEPGLV